MCTKVMDPSGTSIMDPSGTSIMDPSGTSTRDQEPRPGTDRHGRVLIVMAWSILDSDLNLGQSRTRTSTLDNPGLRNLESEIHDRRTDSLLSPLVTRVHLYR